MSSTKRAFIEAIELTRDLTRLPMEPQYLDHINIIALVNKKR